MRKLGVPGHEELAMGAIASGGIRVLNDVVIRSRRRFSEAVIDAVTERERIELDRRELAYRGHRTAPIVREKTVILVDDGIATGSTMLAAVAALKQQQPARIVVAAPAAPVESCDELQLAVDELVVIVRPDPFYSVGQSYEIFGQRFPTQKYKSCSETPGATRTVRSVRRSCTIPLFHNRPNFGNFSRMNPFGWLQR